MQLNKNNIDRSQDIVIENEKPISSETIENLNYLYPNGHRINHQIRWFKGSLNRGLRSDMLNRRGNHAQFLLITFI